MTDQLLAGVCEVDITPPVGTLLCGSIDPRESTGIEDPLYVKAIVLESGGTRMAYVVLDLVALLRKEGDEGVRLASERTGIPGSNIVWAATHTHTGPYTTPLLSRDIECVDEVWLSGIPEKFAECVAKADRTKAPVRLSRARGYLTGVGANRRFRFKDGRELNAWLLNSGEEDIQCLGSAGPVDPEVGILSFEDDKRKLIAVLFQYTLHTNANFGPEFSGDYPAVVAARIREEFGDRVATLFVPGACADINPAGMNHQDVGDRIAGEIIRRLRERKPSEGPVPIGAIKREVAIQYRDMTVDQEERIQASQWGDPAKQAFREELEIMRREGETEAKTILQAWHIGETAFASLPGELFVQWGLKIKEQSAFPWTYPVELGGDHQGYLVTEQAWKAGGYESLIARSSKPTWEATGTMVNEAIEMLGELYEKFNS